MSLYNNNNNNNNNVSYTMHRVVIWIGIENIKCNMDLRR